MTDISNRSMLCQRTSTGCIAPGGPARCQQTGCGIAYASGSTTEHGPAVDVVPSDPAKQYRKAAASALTGGGMILAALQAAIPYLHEAKWLPHWFPFLVAGGASAWTAWKQARDAANIAPVNLTMPAVRDMRQEIPSVAHEAFHPSAQYANEPISILPAAEPRGSVLTEPLPDEDVFPEDGKPTP